MDRNYQADAVNSTPDLTTLSSQGYPTNGNASLGIAATQPGAAWFYMITEELRNLIVNAGLTPDHTDLTQLVKAFRTWQNFPTGTVMPWVSKTTIPDNWLIMNGQSLLKTDYSDLNSFINSDGSLDNSGDSTYFDLPDMTGRVWQGCSSYNDVLVALSAGLPNITGTTTWFFGNSGQGTASGAFGQTNSQNTNLGGAYTTLAGVQNTFNASASNAIFGASSTVQPKARQALMIIKA